MQSEKKNKWKKWIFRLSISLNIIFCLGWLFVYINSPTNKLGVLKHDVNVGYFADDSTPFIIPKGITVRDVSPRGINKIGLFEEYRFEVIITTDKANFVNYDIPKDSLSTFGNVYSADKILGQTRQ